MIYVVFLKPEANIQIAIIKGHRDKGSPCLIPLEIGKYPIKVSTYPSMLKNSDWTHLISVGPKPTFFSALQINSWSIESKALQNQSIQRNYPCFSIEVIKHILYISKNSCNNSTFDETCWFGWIIKCISFLSVASTFEQNLTSTYINEIGR